MNNPAASREVSTPKAKPAGCTPALRPKGRGIEPIEINTIYAELATIQREGNTAKMVSLFNYKKTQKTRNDVTYMSIIEPGEYDCKEEKIRVSNFTMHSKNMGGGEVVSSESSTNGWVPLNPHSIDHILWKFACGKR